MCPVHSLVCLSIALDMCKMQQILIHQASQPPLGEGDNFFPGCTLQSQGRASQGHIQRWWQRQGDSTGHKAPSATMGKLKPVISRMEGKKCCNLFSCCTSLPKVEEAVARCTFVSVSSRQSLLLMPECSFEHLHPFVLWAAFGEPLVCPSKLLCASALFWRQAQ